MIHKYTCLLLSFWILQGGGCSGLISGHNDIVFLKKIFLLVRCQEMKYFKKILKI